MKNNKIKLHFPNTFAVYSQRFQKKSTISSIQSASVFSRAIVHHKGHKERRPVRFSEETPLCPILLLIFFSVLSGELLPF